MRRASIIEATESESDDDLYSLLDNSIHEQNYLSSINSGSSCNLNQVIFEDLPMHQAILNAPAKNGIEQPSSVRQRRCSEMEVRVIRRDSGFISEVSANTIQEEFEQNSADGTEQVTSDANSRSTKGVRIRPITRPRSISFNEKVGRVTYDGESWKESCEILAAQLEDTDIDSSEETQEKEETTNRPFRRRISFCTSSPSKEASKKDLKSTLLQRFKKKKKDLP